MIAHLRRIRLRWNRVPGAFLFFLTYWFGWILTMWTLGADLW